MRYTDPLTISSSTMANSGLCQGKPTPAREDQHGMPVSSTAERLPRMVRYETLTRTFRTGPDGSTVQDWRSPSSQTGPPLVKLGEVQRGDVDSRSHSELFHPAGGEQRGVSFHPPPANHSIDHGGGAAKGEDPDAQNDQGDHNLDQSEAGGGFHCSPPLVDATRCSSPQLMRVPVSCGAG